MDWNIEELQEMMDNGIAVGTCSECGAQSNVEPDASDYDCHECGAKKTVNSALVEGGFI